MPQTEALDPRAVAEAIDRHVRPETFPVAIRVLRGGEPLPPKVRRPLQDMGIRISICQGISMARRYGWSIAMGEEDLSCPIALVAFGFAPAIPYYTEGNLAAGMYVETCGQGKLTEEEVPRFAAEEAGVVVAAPLARANFEPETVLVYGNSAQVMRLVTAALWKRGGALTSATAGRADCADIVVKTWRTGEPQFILPCYGDRVFGQTQDHEMAFTIPWSRVPELLEGLEGTHRGGVRYPIPHYLRYEARFPDTYEHMKQLLEEARRQASAGTPRQDG
ncbi:DUF169 domain-containing protein [Caldinitratiruptor microaerophilus]|uniref:DUF169 domain-containing protein n=1 Tax=Caldinitratiruptor microaerophilus TaxID=671077 RepID=A0AA35CKL7_9FIRM|nr:DUF169 domain-containing protein [Caldinitratiruptor microaerophilus]BDG60947.1 hypothetical protein caldi_20370 [Caldinitratiruptor microaerophilus]